MYVVLKVLSITARSLGNLYRFVILLSIAFLEVWQSYQRLMFGLLLFLEFGVLPAGLMPGQICTSFVAARLEVLHDRSALPMERQLHDVSLLDVLQVLKWIEKLLVFGGVRICISMH